MTNHKAGFRINIPRDLNLHDSHLRFFSVNPSKNIYEILINPPLVPQVEQIFDEAIRNQPSQK
jgi:hypothetical protein